MQRSFYAAQQGRTPERCIAALGGRGQMTDTLNDILVAVAKLRGLSADAEHCTEFRLVLLRYRGGYPFIDIEIAYGEARRRGSR